MNFSFFKKKSSIADIYLGLFLKESKGEVMIIESTGKSISITHSESFDYSNGWENLTNDIEEILFHLEKKIGRQLTKTIFFMYSHFIDDKAGDIKKPYLQKIKDLVKNLELTALGYIECHEAVSSFLQKREEISLTAILIEIDVNNLGIFIYKGGKINYKIIVSRTDNIVEDIIKGLTDLKGKYLLPSRVILYDSQNLDSTSDKILTHKWGSEYFVQLPRVDILTNSEVTEGLINVFGQQIGLHINRENTPDIEDKKNEIMGFLINDDVKQLESNSEDNMVLLEKKDFFGPIKQLANSLFFKFKSLFGFRKKININLSGKYTIYVGFFIIIISLFLNEYFFHKAEVKLYMPSKTINKKADLDILYDIASTSATLTHEMATTGEKEIGDPATGKVTIHNFDDKEKIFSKGSALDYNGLKFLLDTEVKVASSTLAPDGSAKLPGKAQSTVTASNIGKEGNLEKGKRFKIDDLVQSLYFAVNEGAFTNGTRKVIKTVSKTDQANLTAKVINQSKKQSDFSKIKGEVIISLTETDLVKTNFSKEIGEEGDRLSLKATVQTRHFFYKKEDLLNQIKEIIKKEIESGYSLEDGQINYKINKAEKKGKNVKLSLDIKASAIMNINISEVKNSLIGKNKNSLDKILKDQFKAEGYDLKIDQSLPFINNYLPFLNKNISLIMTTL